METYLRAHKLSVGDLVRFAGIGTVIVTENTLLHDGTSRLTTRVIGSGEQLVLTFSNRNIKVAQVTPS